MRTPKGGPLDSGESRRPLPVDGRLNGRGPETARVCNGVCNRRGHNLTRPGTTWHNRALPEAP